MKNKNSEKEWLNDFNEFVNSEGVEVPSGVTDRLFLKVRSDLNPSSWLVFFKLLGIHTVVGTLSLAICNQFDLNPFRTGFSLSDYFMKFGHSTCMFLCGLIFISLSLVMSRYLLRTEEFWVVKKNAPLQVFALSMLSIGAFAAVGAEMVLSFTILWFVGSLVGGAVIMLFQKQRSAVNQS